MVIENLDIKWNDLKRILFSEEILITG